MPYLGILEIPESKSYNWRNTGRSTILTWEEVIITWKVKMKNSCKKILTSAVKHVADCDVITKFNKKKFIQEDYILSI